MSLGFRVQGGRVVEFRAYKGVQGLWFWVGFGDWGGRLGVGGLAPPLTLKPKQDYGP